MIDVNEDAGDFMGIYSICSLSVLFAAWWWGVILATFSVAKIKVDKKTILTKMTGGRKGLSWLTFQGSSPS